MKFATFSLIIACFLVSTVLGQRSRQQSLESYFDDRQRIEDLIDCFVNKRPCTNQEQKIKDQAYATMRNFGQCPTEFCPTQNERDDMRESMQLLQTKYPDLWNRLVGAMLLGIDFGK